MNWVESFLLILVAILGVLAGIIHALYMIGCLILRRERYQWRGVSPVYNGKEPYTKWAEKMEHARRIQAKEEARGD